MITANFDGSSRGNPGPSKIGFVIYEDGTELESERIPIPDGTNNEAEYKGLILLCKRLAQMGVQEVVIQGDSQLVINQVNGTWKTKKEHLQKLRIITKNYLDQIPNWKLEWVRREKNQKADSLAQG